MYVIGAQDILVDKVKLMHSGGRQYCVPRPQATWEAPEGLTKDARIALLQPFLQQGFASLRTTMLTVLYLHLVLAHRSTEGYSKQGMPLLHFGPMWQPDAVCPQRSMAAQC